MSLIWSWGFPHVLLARFSEHGNSHWLKALERSKIPFGPVNSIPDTFSDPQVKIL